MSGSRNKLAEPMSIMPGDADSGCGRREGLSPDRQVSTTSSHSLVNGTQKIQFRGNDGSFTSFVKDVLTLDTESGIRDPIDVAPDERPTESFLALQLDLNDQQQTDAFEARKREVGLGFAPAWGGMMLLANTLLGGSGMLGIPHAFAVAGYGLGTFFIIFFACSSAFGCHLIACSVRKLGRAPCSFYSVSKVVVPRWTWLVDGAVAIKCLGVSISYLIIVGDLYTEAMQGFGLYSERWLSTLMGWVIGGSLACLDSLSALRHTASAALGIVLWTAILIVLYGVRRTAPFDPCPGYEGELPCNGAKIMAVGDDSLAILKALPVFIFGFTCQQNVFTICNEVSVASNKRVNNLIILPAYTITATSFIIVALLGYQTYGDQIASNVLKQYPSSLVANVTKIVFAVLVIFSYPLQIHPSRTSFLAIWRLLIKSGPATSPSAWDEQQSRVEKRRFYIATALLLVGSLVSSLVVQDLGVVLGCIGATGSTTVSYILPGLVYFATFRKWSVKRCFALGQLCLGLVIMPVCLTVILMGGSGH